MGDRNIVIVNMIQAAALPAAQPQSLPSAHPPPTSSFWSSPKVTLAIVTTLGTICGGLVAHFWPPAAPSAPPAQTSEHPGVQAVSSGDPPSVCGPSR
jgi:hypothetical protein